MDEFLKRRIEDVLPEVRWETIAPPYPEYNYFLGSDLYPFRHDANVFNIVNAWWLIEASTLAYSEPEFARGKFVKAGLPEVMFFSGDTTHCYVASNDNFVIVAFRGTEHRGDSESVLADITTDCGILMISTGRGGSVHRGFKWALDEVWEKNLLPYIRSKDDGHRTIWFTGHSLGAALATVAADRYANVRGLYTFGSPRVGDEDFKRDFRINAYRIVNGSDIVARVPPKGVYRHVGNLKHIDGEGILRNNPPRWETPTQNLGREISFLLEPPDPTRAGFSPLVPDCIVDHVPILYATHLWNNIP